MICIFIKLISYCFFTCSFFDLLELFIQMFLLVTYLGWYFYFKSDYMIAFSLCIWSIKSLSIYFNLLPTLSSWLYFNFLQLVIDSFNLNFASKYCIYY